MKQSGEAIHLNITPFKSLDSINSSKGGTGNRAGSSTTNPGIQHHTATTTPGGSFRMSNSINIQRPHSGTVGMLIGTPPLRRLSLGGSGQGLSFQKYSAPHMQPSGFSLPRSLDEIHTNNNNTTPFFGEPSRNDDPEAELGDLILRLEQAAEAKVGRGQRLGLVGDEVNDGVRSRSPSQNSGRNNVNMSIGSLLERLAKLENSHALLSGQTKSSSL